MDPWLDRPSSMQWNAGDREDKLLNHRKWRTGPAGSRSHPPKPTTGAGSPGVMMLPAAWLLAIGRRPCFCSSSHRIQRGSSGVENQIRVARAVDRRIDRDLLSRPASCMLRDSTRRGSGAPAASCYQTQLPSADRHVRRPQCPWWPRKCSANERTAPARARPGTAMWLVADGSLSHSLRWKRSRLALP